ncbi:MAG: hypothetical protein KDD33_06605 [Bdellovibrionales bacterium]|nr:hypothetical protein [Bdellovibrionales bacterium]
MFFSLQGLCGDCDGITCGQQGSAFLDQEVISALDKLDIKVDGPVSASDPRAEQIAQQREADRQKVFDNFNNSPLGGGGGGGGGSGSGSSTGLGSSGSTDIGAGTSLPSYKAVNNNANGDPFASDFKNQSGSPDSLFQAQLGKDKDGIGGNKKDASGNTQVAGLLYGGSPTSGRLPGSSAKKAGNDQNYQDKGFDPKGMWSGYHGAAGGGASGGRFGHNRLASAEGRNLRDPSQRKGLTSAEDILRKRWLQMKNGGRGLASHNGDLFKMMCNHYNRYAQKNKIESYSSHCQ